MRRRVGLRQRGPHCVAGTVPEPLAALLLAPRRPGVQHVPATGVARVPVLRRPAARHTA